MMPRWAAESIWIRVYPYEAYDILIGKSPTLAPRTRQHLVAALGRALPDLRTEELFSRKPRFFDELDDVVLAIERGSDELLAIMASRWIDDPACGPFLHIAIQLIVARFRGTRLFVRMWSASLRSMVESISGIPAIIALRTCNPVVLNVLNAFRRVEGVRVYPDLDGDQQHPELESLARRVARHVAPDLQVDFGRGIIRDAGVPADFYPAFPASRNADVTAYVRRHLAISDRLLCVLTMIPQAAKDGVLRYFRFADAPSAIA
jgi:hypothetical protein